MKPLEQLLELAVDIKYGDRLPKPLSYAVERGPAELAMAR